MNKPVLFKEILNSSKLEFLMEGHSAISGKIIEEAEFKGIWASSLSISASLGLRDNNEASFTEILNVVEYICDFTTIPLLLDADTGYGNFNNARRLIRMLEKIGVAVVCIEDKQFPKKNSFIDGEKQLLADVDEYCGKIKAMKDAQSNPGFCVVARTEAFITGRGLDEALRRAEAYYRAGADAIFVHSKSTKPDEILSFTKEWKNRCPVIIAPTTYSSTPTEIFENAGISLVIWANFMLRASIMNMQSIAKQIQSHRSVTAVEKDIIPIEEIFRLQNVHEFKEAEKKYLPVSILNHTSHS